MKYFDITPILSSRTAVFPGDKSFSRSVACDFKSGDNLLVSSIETTLHIGAHTDAPNHYHAEDLDIASVSLENYLGRAQVIEIKKPRASRIKWSDFEGKTIQAPRILIKTQSYPNSESWNGDFVALSAEVVDNFSKAGVKLVGIDTPSVDPADDKILESHAAVYRNSMSILEGIDLSQVQEGIYTLLALPLKIEGADASPVRAILIDQDLGIP